MRLAGRAAHPAVGHRRVHRSPAARARGRVPRDARRGRPTPTAAARHRRVGSRSRSAHRCGGTRARRDRRAGRCRCCEVFNKCDRLTSDERDAAGRAAIRRPCACRRPPASGLDVLVASVTRRLALETQRVTLEFDEGDEDDRQRIARLYRHARVRSHEAVDGRVSIEADVPRRLLGRLHGLRFSPMSAHTGAVVPDRPFTGAAWSRVAIVITLAFAGACAANTPAAVAPVNPAFPGYRVSNCGRHGGCHAATRGVSTRRRGTCCRAGRSRAAARGLRKPRQAAPGFYPALTGQAIPNWLTATTEAVSLFDQGAGRESDYLPALVGPGRRAPRRGPPARSDRRARSAAGGRSRRGRAPDPARSAAAGQHRASGRRRTGRAEARRSRRCARGAGRRRFGRRPRARFMLRELAAVERQAGDLDRGVGSCAAGGALDDRGGCRPRHCSATSSSRAATSTRRQGPTAGRRSSILAAPYRTAHQRRRATGCPRRAARGVSRDCAEPRSSRAADLAALLGVSLEPWLSRRRRAGCGAHHRRARTLGAALDPRRGARRADGGLSEPHVPAGTRRASRRSRRSRAAARSIAAATRSHALADRWRSHDAGVRRPPADACRLRWRPRSAVAAGVMAPDPGAVFAPARLVSGAEAAATVDRLASLVAGR